MRFQAEPLRLERNVPPPANGSRIGGGLPSGGLQDLRVRLGEEPLVADVLPDDEPLDDAVQPLALRALELLGRELAPGRDGRVVDELREEHGAAAASGRRAHHRCSVDGWPCRIDFSRADSRLIASSGNATSISLRFCTTTTPLPVPGHDQAAPERRNLQVQTYRRRTDRSGATYS